MNSEQTAKIDEPKPKLFFHSFIYIYISNFRHNWYVQVMCNVFKGIIVISLMKIIDLDENIKKWKGFGDKKN